MNTINMLRLADHIEKQPDNYDQGCYISEGYGCETPGCIGGFAAELVANDAGLQFYQWLDDGRGKAWNAAKVIETAIRFLDISEADSCFLFAQHPSAYRQNWNPCAEEATETLRHIAVTGEIAWIMLFDPNTDDDTYQVWRPGEDEPVETRHPHYRINQKAAPA